jgi:hypothetical protein
LISQQTGDGTDEPLRNAQKINNCLLFSTFICVSQQITNIISMIVQQAPEYGVSKITDILHGY